MAGSHVSVKNPTSTSGYYFDYGDRNEFEVEVIDIRPQAEPGQYPRVVDSKGEAPPQYDWPDEDEDT